ncbi:MAG: hypothetical protein M3198_13330 [Actinomycetota bacterium]|nr:hypothetical protein [Actinomycetota bacterium]
MDYGRQDVPTKGELADALEAWLRVGYAMGFTAGPLVTNRRVQRFLSLECLGGPELPRAAETSKTKSRVLAAHELLRRVTPNLDRLSEEELAKLKDPPRDPYDALEQFPEEGRDERALLKQAATLLFRLDRKDPADPEPEVTLGTVQVAAAALWKTHLKWFRENRRQFLLDNFATWILETERAYRGEEERASEAPSSESEEDLAVEETPAAAHGPPTRSEATERPSRPARWRRTRWLVGWGTILVALVGLVIVVARPFEEEGPAPPSPARHTPKERAPPRPRPKFAPLVKGQGSERTRARGEYAGDRVVIRSALALNLGDGRVWIELFPEPVSCASWNLGSPSGVFFLATVTVTPRTLRSLPVGRPLREYRLWWTRRRGSKSRVDGVDGRLTLTSIDTHPGGYWRGRLSVPRGLSAYAERQRLQGTFAAEWCGDAKPGVNALAEVEAVRKITGTLEELKGVFGDAPAGT